ncbi:MAG: bifunctional riboflavin kinase/FAD synthetase [Methylophilaceae bacterium]|nr:bifunctional riboflavin kinase/FAD synthetase [Methylophilaceae bacterium]
MQVFRHLPEANAACAVTIGNYDGLHLGHQKILETLIFESKKRQLETAVITFDPHPKEFFSPASAPSRIISLREKLEFFEELNIDRVYIIKFDKKFSEIKSDEFINILKVIKTNLVVVGEDFKFGNKREGTINHIANELIEVIGVKEITSDGQRISSTTIRQSLHEGDFLKVELLMGRPYSISGKIIHGNKLAREIGFPTANIHMFHNRPPLNGVFAVKLGSNFGVANLGTRPTIGGISKLHLEVHLFNFSDDVYGKHVHVIFLKKIREELKFNSIDELKEQILIDIEKVNIYIQSYDR